MQRKLRLVARFAFSLSLILISGILFGQSKQQHSAHKKILFVVTSHDQLGNTGQKTGYYLSEVAHPWLVLHEAGYEIDFVSPEGGHPPVDAFNLEDTLNNRFWKDSTARQRLTHSLTPAQIIPSQYNAIFYAGGHGAMWDFPDNNKLARITAKIYEQGGIVGAVCHGPAALVNIKLSNGEYLIKGKKVNGFTNDEERAKHLDHIVPFLLESKLRQRGGLFEKSPPFKPHIAIDSRLITGQNPASATAVGKAIVQALKKQENQSH